MNKQEIEVKFLIEDMKAVVSTLVKNGAELVSPRVHEFNLRFDTPDRSLSAAFRVLRLRQDTHSRLTFKGPAKTEQGVSTRQEIEFEVSDFETAREFLEALGYEVSIVYEKFRTSYRLNTLEVVLDEMPYGFFVEIEGPQAASIRETAEVLRLDWSARSTLSYLALFEHFKTSQHKATKDLTFETFKNITATPQDLGLTPADHH